MRLPRCIRLFTATALAAMAVAMPACSTKTSGKYAHPACGARLPERVAQALHKAGPDGTFHVQLAVMNDNKWPDGSTLRVHFLDGDETLRALILASAQQWSNYANIRFVRVNSEPSDIRVSAASRDNSFWAYYGNDANNHPGEQTVHLGFVDGASTSPAYLNEYVWHEFGHALAAVHEHQSPASPIQWNKPVVYQYYADNYGWSHELVDDNIFYMFSADDVSATPFDPLSIMLYAFPKEFTTNGYSTHDNAVLSDVDKSFMRRMYP